MSRTSGTAAERAVRATDARHAADFIRATKPDPILVGVKIGVRDDSGEHEVTLTLDQVEKLQKALSAALRWPPTDFGYALYGDGGSVAVTTVVEGLQKKQTSAQETSRG